jgi:hypothetical protein
MRPGQIRVFDGLRVTTEHVDHFQASLHSAIQDIREILGLGIVHAGFEVAAGDGRTVTVQPGLAFDFQKNRVIADEPQQVEVSFGEQQDIAYVCAKYDQVEEGETEGRHTLIFDGCSIVVRGTLPGAADNLVVLAQVTRDAVGALTVTDLTHGAPKPPPAAEDAEPAAPAPSPPLSVAQGVLRLTSGPAEGYPGSSLVELIRSSQATITGSGHDLMLTLATAPVPADFDVRSLSAHVLTTVSLAPHEGDAVTVNAASAAEATCSADGLTQFGVTPRGSAAVAITEDTFARVALVDSAAPAGSPFHELLKRLAIVVRAERAGAALNVVCHLVWTDITTAELITQLEVSKPGWTWRSQVAWKAIGQH